MPSAASERARYGRIKIEKNTFSSVVHMVHLSRRGERAPGAAARVRTA
jgi:hypothetical protein